MKARKTVKPKINLFQSIELWFFVVTVFAMELLLHLLTETTMTFARFLIILCFSVCYGGILAVIAELTSPWRGKRPLMCVLLAVTGALFATQYFLKITFQTYMTLESILAAGGNVATEFSGAVFSLIFQEFWIIALFLLPTLLYALFGKTHGGFDRNTMLRGGLCFLLAAVFFGLGTFTVNVSADKPRYKEQYNFDAACQSFGLLTGFRLELTNSSKSSDNISFQIQDVPEEPDEEDVEEPDPAETPEPSEEPSTEEPSSEETPKTTNEMAIDFAALAEEEDNDTVAQLHSYVASLKADKVNQYTGMFKDKNLIFITAEAFSKEIIDPELTPTLYRLANKGIVFEEYYQPAWGGSTSTGEYANITGLIPTDGVSSIQDTIGHNMYFTLGNQLQRLGYHSAAYHNGTHTYYDRDKTHCNLGYSTFMALGNGMEEGVQEVWPESDLEMIDFTVPQFIDKQPFSIYYMTVSGHGNYVSGNAMADKNYDAVAHLEMSEVLKRYYAANMELEYALTSLIKQLEDAGIADDTVIVLGTDHYPYGLEQSEAWGNEVNYLIELYGYEPVLNPEQDHSALIIWSGCLEEQAPIVVDTPVYSLDIVPTLSNLFGLEYDSRLLVGRDVFSNQQPLVIWADYSWLTEKGYYSTSFGTFTPNEGVAVSDDYVDRIKAVVANKFSFSRGVLDYDYYGILFGEDDVQ
ncbi:MAG: LTA synthase family protein [Ruminococcaceae bacterium]|nr:LTA synthase family protein [Oscillospiraceae bacterium]